MAIFSFDDSCFSDFYKTVYNIRPHGHQYYTSTPEEKQEIWDRLVEQLEAAVLDEKTAHELASRRFEERIVTLMQCGAKTRKQAIDWLKGDESSDDDLEFKWDLPVGYLLQN